MTDLTSTGPTHAGEGKIWPRTDLLDLLGITHPIIQAPMSGFGGPVLVGAVSNAGALGSLGCGAVPNQTARDQVQEIRRATNRPFSLNFFAHAAPRIDADVTHRMRQRLRAYYDELDLGVVPDPSDPLPVFDEERLQLVLDLRPPVVSFHFGLPPADKLKRVKRTGAVVLCSATTVAEPRYRGGRASWNLYSRRRRRPDWRDGARPSGRRCRAYPGDRRRGYRRWPRHCCRVCSWSKRRSDRHGVSGMSRSHGHRCAPRSPT